MTEETKQPTEDEIFSVARLISDAEARSRYLEQACTDNAQLRQEVEELLAVYDGAESFLESPPPNLVATTDKTNHSTTNPAGLSGSTIGPYKLLEPIGEGGMGNVYMAEQTVPVRRKVALKVVKSGLDTKAVLARFEAERQAMALMDHPGIAKFYDAGISNTGSPYFVMELIRGRPITEFCRKHQINTEAKLELISQACQAVQHAHQKGIIHRDLKPSNVLVALYDDRPVVKIIDFGVAKAIGEKLTDKTMFTRFGQLIGTLEYMSPEQAQLNQLDVDTRSDIYSLGAILYELLTGEPPFEKEQLSRVALDEILRIIREDEPAAPSKRHSSLSSTVSDPSPAKRKDNLDAGLTIPADLDWIVMRCLEKDRSRRYATTNDLAQDIERYLQNEPVSACPPSSVYRLRKFLNRNRVAVFVASVVLASLLVCIGVSTWQAALAVQARNTAIKANTDLNHTLTALDLEKQAVESQRKIAVAEGRRAAENFEYAFQSLNDFLVRAPHFDPTNGSRLRHTRQATLIKAARYFRQLVESNPKRMDLQGRFAETLYHLGNVSIVIGDVELADAFFQESIDIRKHLLTEKYGSPQSLAQLIARAYRGRTRAWQERRFELTRKYFGEAIRLYQSANTVEEKTENSLRKELRNELAATTNEYGVVLARHRRFKEAVSQFQLALNFPNRLHGPILANLAEIEFQQGNLDEAMKLIRQASSHSKTEAIRKRTYAFLKAKIYARQQKFDLARKACNAAVRAARSLNRGASSRVADARVLCALDHRTTDAAWLTEGLLLKGKLIGKVGRHHNRAMEAIREARAIHISYANIKLDPKQLRLRRNIEEALANEQAALGHHQAADYSRALARELDEALKLIPASEPGVTFSVGGGRSDSFSGVALDDQGFAYVVGNTDRAADFQTGNITRRVAPSEYAPSVVVKYSLQGSVVWIRTLAAPLQGAAKAICLNRHGSLFVTGTLNAGARRTAQFGKLNMRLPKHGRGPLGYLAKISMQGKIEWVRWTGWTLRSGEHFDYAVAATPSGGAVIGGGLRYDSTIGDEQHSVRLSNPVTANNRRGYLAKFASDGTVEWAQAINAKLSHVGGIACDPQGNIVFCGHVVQDDQPVTIGKYDKQQTRRLLSPSMRAKRFGFLVRLNADGELLWTRTQVSTRTQDSQRVVDNFDVTVGTTGKIYLTSRVLGNMDLDGTQSHPTNQDRVARHAKIHWDGNLSCWSDKGELLWQRRMATDGGYVSPYKLTPRSKGGVFVAGRVVGADLIFGEGRVSRYTGFSRDSFVLAVDNNGKRREHWFYTTGRRPARTVVWAVASNKFDQLAIVGWSWRKMRTPTGEILQSDDADAFLTIFHKKRRREQPE